MANAKHMAQYIFGRTFLGTLGLLPLPVASALGAGLGGFIATIPNTKNVIARKNIRLCLPSLSEQEVNEVHYKSTQNFVQTLFEMPALYKLKKTNFKKYIEVEGVENMLNNPGTFILTAHYGNWETISKTLGLHDVPMASIYRRANNPYMDEYITTMRTQDAGGVMIPKGTSGARKLVKAVKGGMTAGFLNDQKMSDGVDSVLFGQDVKSPSGIADLAIKYERMICPVFCVRTGLGKFKLTFEKPITLKTTGNAVEDSKTAIQELNRLLEERIKQHPDHWLWQHNRFNF